MKHLKKFENYSLSVKDIANELSEKMHCDRFGSCVHFAEELVLKIHDINPNLLNDFYVVEGYVDWSHGDGVPQQHTWIELLDGERLDPTYVQFSKYGSVSYLPSIKNKFTGLEYYNDTIVGTWFSERRKKYPDMFFKK